MEGLNEIMALDLFNKVKKREEEASRYYNNKYVVRSLYNVAEQLREIAQRSLTNPAVITTNKSIR